MTTAFQSPWLTRGPLCAEFERRFAQYVGARHAISTNSSSIALFASLLAMGVGPQDLVILPAFTFTATAEAVLFCGATPLLIDCEQDTLCMSYKGCSAAIDWATQNVPACRVAAVLPVHYGGFIDSEIAQRDMLPTGIRFLHDASHCVPARFATSDGSWRRVGELQEAACYSFYANKCITTCEGGMISTNDDLLAARLRAITNHGVVYDDFPDRVRSRHHYDVRFLGVKGTMPDPLAALGLMQLADADAFLERRTRVAQQYRERLASCDWLELPDVERCEGSSWHLFAIRLNLNRLAISRDEVLRSMSELGVGCSYHWKPLHLHTLYSSLIREGRVFTTPLPTCEHEWKRLISLPIYPSLSEDEIEYVCNCLISIGEAAQRRVGT